ncbi:MAG: 50S ribosomal protein L3 [Promethearchaeota archaeon]
MITTAHRKKHAPHHGSLAYLPRKRARYAKGRIRHWPQTGGKLRFQGFAGFKAGMTQIAWINDEPNSPYNGHEILSAVTILEAPPLTLFGIKVYRATDYGKKAVGQALAKFFDKHLSRKVKLPDPESYDADAKYEELKARVKPNDEVRGVFHTNPSKASVPRKKPDVIEIRVAGGSNALERLEFAREFLGKEVRALDVLTEGQVVDVVAVSKGKGFQGPVKRAGIKILPRKTRGTKRGVGCIGPWKPPRVMYTVPRPGQLGYHQRVEYHKRVVKIGEKGEEVTPKGGFVRYGLVRGDYVMLLGSVPGPKKRLVRLRETIRAVPHDFKSGPEITYISTLSQQGR